MSDEQYARAGRTMFLLFWLILFAGLFFFFYNYGKPDAQVFVAKQGELTINSGRDGHYRIPGTINDYPVDFLLDTGATTVAIPQNVADKLHITGRYPITITTANGEVTGSLTRLSRLSFGDFKFADVKAVIIPGSNDGVVLLGMNVLSKFNIIQAGNKWVLKQLQH